MNLKKNYIILLLTLIGVKNFSEINSINEDILKKQKALINLHAFKTNPLNLVCPRRFDLMAKYIYAKHRELNVKSMCGTKIYANHLRVWNGFHEKYPPKNSLEDFLNSFDELLDSVKNATEGRDIYVNLDKTETLCNGAHRTVACLLYNRIPFCNQYDVDGLKITADFFRKHRLEEKYLDAMALEYCKLKNNTYVMTVFPSAVGKDNEINKILNKFGRIVYKKKVYIKDNGLINFVKIAYEGEHWLGTQHFSGASSKAKHCF